MELLDAGFGKVGEADRRVSIAKVLGELWDDFDVSLRLEFKLKFEALAVMNLRASGMRKVVLHVQTSAKNRNAKKLMTDNSSFYDVTAESKKAIDSYKACGLHFVLRRQKIDDETAE